MVLFVFKYNIGGQRRLHTGALGGLRNVAAGEPAEMRLRKGFSRRCGDCAALAATQKFDNLDFPFLWRGLELADLSGPHPTQNILRFSNKSKPVKTLCGGK